MPRIRDIATLADQLGLSPETLKRYIAGTLGKSSGQSVDKRWEQHFGGGRFAAARFGLKTPKTLGDALAMLERQTSPAPETDPEADQQQRVGSTRRAPAHKPYAPTRGAEDEEPHFSDEFLVPSSSNVFSYQYFRRPHDRLGILYVTFKGSHINPDAVRVGRVKKGKSTSRSQLIGNLGSTVGGKKGYRPGANEDSRGATYAYYDVPAEVFARMKAAASKGKFVWDALRVRGTIYGHRYRYSLVTGSPTDEGKPYIPRRATSTGFRTRSLADPGTGKRGFRTSTLPASRLGGGFTTRRAP